MKKARHLPMFGPGLVITVPLSLLPEYRELYQLQELDRGEAMEVKRQSKRSLSGILLVKRVSKTMEPK